MMTQDELVEYIKLHVKNKIPYKKEPPYSLEQGFNCYAWAEYIYGLVNKNVGKEAEEISTLRRRFVIIKSNPRFLDIPLFYVFMTGGRHIGVMLNEFEMTQCSSSTNGVATCDINDTPWKHTLKYFYRLKDEN